MDEKDSEVLKVRMKGFRMVNALSDDFKNKLFDELDLDLHVASIVFIGEDGIAILSHDNKKSEEEEIFNIESDSEDILKKIQDALTSIM